MTRRGSGDERRWRRRRNLETAADGSIHGEQPVEPKGRHPREKPSGHRHTEGQPPEDHGADHDAGGADENPHTTATTNPHAVTHAQTNPPTTNPHNVTAAQAGAAPDPHADEAHSKATVENQVGSPARRRENRADQPAPGNVAIGTVSIVRDEENTQEVAADTTGDGAADSWLPVADKPHRDSSNPHAGSASDPHGSTQHDTSVATNPHGDEEHSEAKATDPHGNAAHSPAMVENQGSTPQDQADTRANQPAADAVPVGSRYWVTDEGEYERTNGTSWQAITAATDTVSYDLTWPSHAPSTVVLGPTGGILGEGWHVGGTIVGWRDETLTGEQGNYVAVVSGGYASRDLDPDRTGINLIEQVSSSETVDTRLVTFDDTDGVNKVGLEFDGTGDFPHVMGFRGNRSSNAEIGRVVTNTDRTNVAAYSRNTPGSDRTRVIGRPLTVDQAPVGDNDVLRKGDPDFATSRDSALDLYVDPNGSDSNSGGSGDPFATIQHAVDVGREEMPRANTVIHIADGLYNEDVDINHLMSGGNFNLIGDTTTPTNVELGNLLVRNARALNVRASGVTFTKDRTDTPYDYIYGVIVLNSSLVQISDCAFTSGPTRGIDAEDSLVYSISNDFGSSNLERANVANKGGRVISRSNTGHTTINGNWATVGGTVAKYDTTQPTGDGADDYHNAGGTIVEVEDFVFDNDARFMDDAGGYLRVRGTTEGRHLLGGYDSGAAEHFRLEWDQGTGLLDLRSFDSPSGANLITRIDSPNDRIRLMAPNTRVDGSLSVFDTLVQDRGGIGEYRLNHTTSGTRNYVVESIVDDSGSAVTRTMYGPGDTGNPGQRISNAGSGTVDTLFDGDIPIIRVPTGDANILLVHAQDSGGDFYGLDIRTDDRQTGPGYVKVQTNNAPISYFMYGTPHHIAPSSDGNTDLGKSSSAFGDLYYYNANNVSDPAAKHDMRPVAGDSAARRIRDTAKAAIGFRWPDGQRTHLGFDADLVAQAHGDESAAFNDPHVNGDPAGAPGSVEPRKALRVNELIPDLYVALADALDRIDELENA